MIKLNTNYVIIRIIKDNYYLRTKLQSKQIAYKRYHIYGTY